MHHDTADGLPPKAREIPAPATGWRASSSAWAFLSAARSDIRPTNEDNMIIAVSTANKLVKAGRP